jgi:EAL domain-containing protein (putative c-di-GMP-specific phosphodiesterase class I)
VPVAKSAGLIVPIGKRVLHESCSQAQAWIDDEMAPVRVSVNISAAEFQRRGFVDDVRATLKETRLNPRYLELELTQSVLMQDALPAVLALKELKAIGVRLAIDDFGTAVCSLTHLRQFPIDTLKIDQSFMRGISADFPDVTIIGTMVSMGRTRDPRVVITEIETRDQLTFLRRQGCNEGQGHYLGRPLGAGDFTALIGARKPWSPLVQFARNRLQLRTETWPCASH